MLFEWDEEDFWRECLVQFELDGGIEGEGFDPQPFIEREEGLADVCFELYFDVPIRLEIGITYNQSMIEK